MTKFHKQICHFYANIAITAESTEIVGTNRNIYKSSNLWNLDLLNSENCPNATSIK